MTEPLRRPTLTEQAEALAKELATVKQDAPARFVVGGRIEGRKVTGGISFDRRWQNGWGATAYARAFWDDQPILPVDRFGYIIGGEITKKF